MKISTLLSIATIVAISLLTSCQNKVTQVVGTEKMLDDIGRYLDEHPDSALIALESIDREGLNCRCARAKYALLKSIALDKNYIDIADDSLIRVATDWYQNHGCLEDKAKAYYYQGKVLQNSQNYNAAIVSFTKAEEFEEKAHDNKYIGLACRSISHISNETYQFAEELKYAEKEEAAFRKYGDYDYYGHAKFDLAVASNNNMDFERSEKLYREVIDTAKKRNDTVLLAECIKYYASQLTEGSHKDYAKSIQMMTYVSDDLSYPLWASDYGVLARAYEMLKDEEKSDKCLKQAHSMLSDDPSAFGSVNSNEYFILKEKGDMSGAMSHLEKTVILQDSLIIGLLDKTTTAAQNDYFSNQAAMNATKAEAKRIEAILIFIVALILLISTSAFFIYKKRRLEDEIELKQNSIENMKMSDNEDICGLIQGRLELIREVFIKYNGNKNATRRKDQVLKCVQYIVDKLGTPEEEKSLEDVIDRHFDGIMSALRCAFIKFRETDFRLLAYEISGLKPQAISVFIGKRPDWIYNRKVKLLAEIRKDSAFSERYSVTISKF